MGLSLSGPNRSDIYLASAPVKGGEKEEGPKQSS